MLPFVTGAVLAAVGGLTCDALCKRIGATWGCRLPAMTGLVLVAALLIAGVYASNPYVAVALLSLCFGFTQFTEGAFWSASTYVAGRHTSAATGVMNTGGNAAGFLAPVVGLMVDHLGWLPTLASGSVFALDRRCIVAAHPDPSCGLVEMEQTTYDDTLGAGYAGRRKADPNFERAIVAALADARSVINVGAGTGSYEPTDRSLLAVEPSSVMIRQRSAGAAPCVRASAELLPVADAAFDAAMAVLTIHHWSDWRRGLRELRRVARQRIVLVTFDNDAADFWLTRDYFPELLALDRKIMPSLDALAAELGTFQSTPLLVPHDCADGFLGAYWRRPEIYLDPAARRSMSSFARIDADLGLRKLASDLESGVWRKRNADILDLEALDLGYRLLLWELDR